MPRMRITVSDLDAAVHTLNRTAGTPDQGWITGPDGTNTAQVGHYGVEAAYGGVKLVQIVNSSGGCTDVLGSGFTTKRDLYCRIHAMIAGVRAVRLEKIQNPS